ncbi:hypothetical protein K501DRAFT_197268 [Backusella circina FSU 941]|nr:hypothetical protein K501DRAFT_310752 [Backusella circina FSU 941]KAI8877836.1 hypothetical protein K501DRAFT_197268 [Backusella circina FSU 941]
MYGVENVLSNDSSVYCSGRKGPVNILMKYCGYLESGIDVDRSCIISRIVIKAPQRGYTAPCKEGLVFISNHEIDVNDTQQFDHYTEQDFINHHDDNKSTDPVAWFSLSDDKLSIINISERSGKYMLIKLLRADRGNNIDLQYIGVLGYCGSRSFESGMLQ